MTKKHKTLRRTQISTRAPHEPPEPGLDCWVLLVAASAAKGRCYVYLYRARDNCPSHARFEYRKAHLCTTFEQACEIARTETPKKKQNDWPLFAFIETTVHLQTFVNQRLVDKSSPPTRLDSDLATRAELVVQTSPHRETPHGACGDRHSLARCKASETSHRKLQRVLNDKNISADIQDPAAPGARDLSVAR